MERAVHLRRRIGKKIPEPHFKAVPESGEYLKDFRISAH